jgi:hypothetical protein
MARALTSWILIDLLRFSWIPWISMDFIDFH